MIFFGKKSDYIKFSKVISILEDERIKYHHASRSDLEKSSAIKSAIRALKLYHVKNNPSHYMELKKVFNKEAYYLLESEKIKERKDIKPVAVWKEKGGEG